MSTTPVHGLLRHRVRGLTLLGSVLVCSLVLACGGSSKPAPTSTPSPSSTATLAPVPTATATSTPLPTPTPLPRPDAIPFPDDLKQKAMDYLQQIAKLRGDPDPRPVDMFLLTRDQARAFYSNGQPTPTPTPEGATPAPTATPAPRPLDPHQALYELLGLVPPQQETGQTVQQQQTSNLISIITGFYSPLYNAFYMIDTINGGIYGPLATSTIVHELTHALQYQETDINAIAQKRAGDFDATTALLDVMEGDAVHTEIEVLGYSTRSTYRQPQCFTIPAPQRPGTPYVVERELDTWYEDGLCFIQAIADKEGPQGIADVFKNLPTTTEQILHPEKYLAGETGMKVTLPDLTSALGGSWKKLSQGDFGEFGLQNVLLAGLPDDRTAVQTAAAGWNGDAWDLYASGDDRIFHLESQWDTPEDAEEFFSTLGRSLFARVGQGNVRPGPPGYAVTVGNVNWHAMIDGQRVTVLVGTSPTAIAAVAPQLGIH